MIQDIFPHVFHNEFEIKTPKPDSYFLYFQDGRLLLDHKKSRKIPQFEALKGFGEKAMASSDYLFSIDQMDFFL